MASHRFPRTARVRARKDFDRIFKHGRRVALPVLALHFSASDSGSAGSGSDDGPRLGLAVSRKVDPRAVGRNRIKRILRDTFRLHRDRLRPGDYVVVARVGASRASGDALRQAFLQLLQRAGALPRADSGGTMRASLSGEAPASASPVTAPATDADPGQSS